VCGNFNEKYNIPDLNQDPLPPPDIVSFWLSADDLLCTEIVIQYFDSSPQLAVKNSGVVSGFVIAFEYSYSSDQLKNDEMGRACSTYGGEGGESFELMLWRYLVWISSPLPTVPNEYLCNNTRQHRRNNLWS
jgi:hypothetical protein